jgi:hypothetical protein
VQLGSARGAELGAVGVVQATPRTRRHETSVCGSGLAFQARFRDPRADLNSRAMFATVSMSYFETIETG